MSVSSRVAIAFRRLGWFALITQMILAFIPIVVLIFALGVRRFTSDGLSTTLEVILSYGCVLFLGFSLFWSFRYIQLGRRLTSAAPPSLETLRRILAWGIGGNVGGMAVAILISLGAVGRMLFRLLTLPPGAIPMFDKRQPMHSSAFNTTQWIVPLDVVWLQALVNTIAAQLIGIVVSLVLLLLVNRLHGNNQTTGK